MRDSTNKALVAACLAVALAAAGVLVEVTGIEAGAPLTRSRQGGTASIREAALDRDCYAAGQAVGIFVEIDTSLASQDVKVQLAIFDASGASIASTSRTLSVRGSEDDSLVESLTLISQAASGTYLFQIRVFDAGSDVEEDAWTQQFSVDPACGQVTPIISSTPTATATPTTTPTIPPPDVQRLLAVTSSSRLIAKFGGSGWNQIKAGIEALGARLLDVTLDRFEEVDAAIEGIGWDKISAILIVGNHDVVPFSVLDNPTTDGDILYTDDVYADFDHDANVIIDVPVSRIPDGNDLGLVLTQLAGTPLPASGGFSLANVKRPVAETVANMFGATTLWSAPTLHTDVQQSAVTVQYDYFMLHGSMKDTTTWWGEGTSPKYPEAFEVRLANSQGIVLTGCCYGAYVLGKTADNSIALRFLQAGARAFVGCTGIHYSVLGTVPNDNGQLFHSLFWGKVVGGKAPLQAFFETKREYLDQTAMRPVHVKIEHQFVFYGSPGALAPVVPPAPGQPAAGEPWETPEGQRCIEEWQNLVVANLNRTRPALAPWTVSQWGHFLGTNATGSQPEDWGNRWRWVWRVYRANFWLGSEMAWGPGTGVPTQEEYVYRCMGISPP
jgi:hypothetical protein